MNYKEQHTQYLSLCESTLRSLVKKQFQANSIVSEAAAYALLNGGKRVRGVLTLAVCDILSGNLDTAAHFGAALEMIHAFSLIHDDLPCMDDDDMRRGKPATHIQYGEANALLAGDLLALEASRTIAEAPNATAEQKVRAVIRLNCLAGSQGMIYGQELDLIYETQKADEQTLRKIYRNKTGALLQAASELGIIAANYQAEQCPEILKYTENIGLTFQVVDDILDVTSSNEVLGKPVGSDVESNKSTFMTIYGLDTSREVITKLTKEAVTIMKEKYADKAEFLIEFATSLANRVM